MPLYNPLTALPFLAINGATIGSNALAVTGAAAITSGNSIALTLDNTAGVTQIVLKNAGTERGTIAATNNSFVLNSETGNNFLFQGNGTTVASLSATGTLNVCANTATPAAGAAAAVLLFGTTAGFGIYYGSGAPTVSAAQGSIYLRSDGSSTSTRLYVNTNGSTTWTAVTTAA